MKDRDYFLGLLTGALFGFVLGAVAAAPAPAPAPASAPRPLPENLEALYDPDPTTVARELVLAENRRWVPPGGEEERRAAAALDSLHLRAGLSRSEILAWLLGARRRIERDGSRADLIELAEQAAGCREIRNERTFREALTVLADVVARRPQVR